MTLGRHPLVLAAGLSLVAGCADARAPRGPSVEIAVAPLSLPGIGNACYDLEVSNGTDVVWSLGDPAHNRLGADQSLDNGPTDLLVPADADATTVCASQFGNSAGGDITYIGTCDASTDSDGDLSNGVQNEVRIWVDGLYDAAGSVDIGQWRDPCPAAGCLLEVDCNENADTLAAFDFTIMRDANQGFFDVAVNFEDVFCSAKLDCEYGPGEPIELLHHPVTGVRGQTAVVALACTAGPGAAVETVLHMDPISVICDDPSQPGKTIAYALDPSIPPGNAWTAADLASTAPHPIWQYAVYEGTEQLACGVDANGDPIPCNKVYWNVAVGFDPTFHNCHIQARASASSAPTMDNGLTPVHTTYPMIEYNVDLTDGAGVACTQHPLEGADGGVAVTYTDVASRHPFCYRYDGVEASMASICASSTDTIVSFCANGECTCVSITPTAGVRPLNDFDSFACLALADEVHWLD